MESGYDLSFTVINSENPLKKTLQMTAILVVIQVSHVLTMCFL